MSNISKSNVVVGQRISGVLFVITGLFLIGFINMFKSEMSVTGIIFVLILAFFQMFTAVCMFTAKFDKR